MLFLTNFVPVFFLGDFNPFDPMVIKGGVFS